MWLVGGGGSCLCVLNAYGKREQEGQEALNRSPEYRDQKSNI